MIEPLERTLNVRRLDNPWLDSFEATIDGVAVDLSGYSARMQFRLYPGAADPPLLDVSSAAATNAGSVIDMTAGFAGIVTVSLAKADLTGGNMAAVSAVTSAQVFGQMGQPAVIAYDLLLTDPNGNEETWYFGAARIWPGVTAHA